MHEEKVGSDSETIQRPIDFVSYGRTIKFQEPIHFTPCFSEKMAPISSRLK